MAKLLSSDEALRPFDEPDTVFCDMAPAMARLTRRRFVATSGALVALPAPQPLNARGQAPDVGELRVDKDIVFGMGGSKTLTLDVYRPLAGTIAKRTAIVHLFAGGFAAGSKDANYIVNDVKALGARGYTSVAANYRLAREGPWPAQIHDAKAAVRWTRANATRLGVEPNRIVVAGYGAGGLLALLAAGTAGRAEFEGESGAPGRQLTGQRLHRRLSSGHPGERGGALPAGTSNPREPDGRIAGDVHLEGLRADDLHSRHRRRHRAGAIERRLLVEAAALGVPAALNLVQGADGAFDTAALDAVEMMAHAIDLFLDRLLVNRAPYPKFGGRGRGQGGRGAQPLAGRGAN